MTTPYATNKLLYHPDLLADLRAGRVPPSPRVVHFMPELACPHSCKWCSYGHRRPEDGPEAQGWKNMELMDNRARLTWEQASRFLDEFEAMGGRAVELTGGGEPLLWPHVERFFERMAIGATDLELGMVTNGTLLRPEMARAFNMTRWRWARVSIDAGTEETYTRVRRVKASEWERAWRAVRLLAHARDLPGSSFRRGRRVGVGFVVDAGNYDEVYRACRLAKANGADNIRVSIAFTPQHLDRFPEGALEEAAGQARQAREELDEDTFQVVDLVSERAGNLASPAQDYPYCAAKDYLCVVGGDANVYTCCSLAFNPRGLIGSVEPDGFRALWERTMPGFSAAHDPREACPVECLYERRNKEALAMLEASEDELQARRGQGDPPPHLNFL